MRTTCTCLKSQAMLEKVKRLSRSQAQAQAQLVQRVRGCAVSVAGAEWSLSLAPLSEPWAAAQETLLVKAHWAGAPFWLLLPANVAQVWVQSRFPEADLPSLPQSYLALMLESALGDVCAALSDMQRGAAGIDSATESSLADLSALSQACPHAFEMQASNALGTVLIHLATDTLGLVLMAGLAARLPAAVNSLEPELLPVLLRAELGFSWLNAAEFASLCPGDTVLLAHSFTHPGQHLWLGVDGRWGLMVRLDAAQGGNTVEVVQAFSTVDLADFSAPTTHPMTSTNTPSLDGSPAVTALDQVPFRLAFDLGERLMTLGEIKALQVGQPLALDRPLSQAVSLRVNGALVGQGELVEIDGRLGVTITALANMPQP